MEFEQEPSWMDPIVTYLKISELPGNKIEARILRMRASRCVIYDDKTVQKGLLNVVAKMYDTF